MNRRKYLLFATCGLLTVAGWIYMTCKPDKSNVKDHPKTLATEHLLPTKDTAHLFYGICTDSLDIHSYTIRRGDNLSDILNKWGLRSRSDTIVGVTSGMLDFRKLSDGLPYSILTARDSIKKVRYLVFARSRTEHAVISLSGDTVQARLYRKPVVKQERYIKGTVNTSLWKEIEKQGVSPLLAIQLSDIFAWQIDFFELQPEDAFQAFYTESFMDDTVSLGITSVEGAVFVQGGRTYMAIPFTQDSIPEFFDADGQSLRRTFLKAPLDFFRITSRFTNRRFHPVLKYYRAHHGVDYAAPSGTEVKTIGDGKVIAKGFQVSGGGNYVKIQHNSTYVTSYMHLSRFAPGITEGKHVKQGDVIGYVGSTGLSTGPHLDFRVYKNGVPINPLKMESPPAYPVRPACRDSFECVKQELILRLRDSAAYSQQ
ncbi:MAG: peptidoglycan DD-metalloendopeptidase family protein [Tannerella sp.]|nr:peptidoglycan DD-metalloendopeptidase family protein [Tannerella sp.]